MNTTQSHKHRIGLTALVWLLIATLAACSQNDDSPTPEPVADEEITSEDLDALLTTYPNASAKADDISGLYYKLRDGRHIFLGAVADELIALAQAHPNTRQFTSRRGVTYTQSTFAFCAEAGDDRICASYLGRTYQPDDTYALIFGGTLNNRPSLSAYRAGQVTEAMIASNYDVSDFGGGFDYYQGTYFGCVYHDARPRQAFCGLYHEANKQEQTTTRLELSFENLPELGPDFVYEGWLIIDGAPISGGRFDNQAGFDAFTFEFLADRTDAAAYILTIEPRIGDAPGPSDVHLLGGAFENGTANLSMTHPGALGTDFSDASGIFFLATPTAPDAVYSQGIWFIDPAAGAAGLQLPELPAGWVYEGWAVGGEGPVSTGRFTNPAAPDSDGGGPAAGPEAAPPFPGQDFINPAMDLVGATIVISVEPEPDNDPGPFALKPLVGGAEDLGAGVVQNLDQNLGGQPSGVATLVSDSRALNADAVVVANRAEGTVSVLDAEEGHLLKNVVLGEGSQPMYVNHNRATGRIFVGDRGNDQVVVLDDQSYDVVGTVPAAAGIFHMWANPEGGFLYVNADVDKVVAVINVETLELDRLLDLPSDLTANLGKPHDVVADPDGRSIYVSMVGVDGPMDAIIKIDVATGAEVARIMVERDPHLSASPNSDFLFAPVQDGNAVYVLDREDLAVVARLDVTGAHGATITSDGQTFLTTNISGGGTGGLVVVDTNTPEVTTVVDTPYATPHNVISNADASLIFVTHSGGNTDKVSVFRNDGAGNIVLISDVNTGANPFGIGFVAPNH